LEGIGKAKRRMARLTRSKQDIQMRRRNNQLEQMMVLNP